MNIKSSSLTFSSSCEPDPCKDQLCITIHSDQNESPKGPPIWGSPDLRMEGPPIWPILRSRWYYHPWKLSFLITLVSASLIGMYHKVNETFCILFSIIYYTKMNKEEEFWLKPNRVLTQQETIIFNKNKELLSTYRQHCLKTMPAIWMLPSEITQDFMLMCDSEKFVTIYPYNQNWIVDHKKNGRKRIEKNKNPTLDKKRICTGATGVVHQTD